MKDERRLHSAAAPPDTDSSKCSERRYPVTSGLQTATGSVMALLHTYRDQLSDREYEELLQILTFGLAREVAKVTPGCPEWLSEQMRKAS